MQQPSSTTPRPLPSDLLNLHEIVAKARQNLNQNDWDYIVGGAESETTLRRNRMALDAIAFRPRVLRDVSKVDASVSHFGRKLRLPVVLAPVGSLESFHPAGAASVVRAVEAIRRRPHAQLGLRSRASRSSRRRRPMRCVFTSSMCAATRPGSTITSSAPSRTAMRRSA